MELLLRLRYLRLGAVQRCTVLYSTVQCCTALYSAGQHYAVLYNGGGDWIPCFVTSKTRAGELTQGSECQQGGDCNTEAEDAEA